MHVTLRAYGCRWLTFLISLELLKVTPTNILLKSIFTVLSLRIIMGDKDIYPVHFIGDPFGLHQKRASFVPLEAKQDFMDFPLYFLFYIYIIVHY